MKRARAFRIRTPRLAAMHVAAAGEGRPRAPQGTPSGESAPSALDGFPGTIRIEEAALGRAATLRAAVGGAPVAEAGPSAPAGRLGGSAGLLELTSRPGGTGRPTSAERSRRAHLAKDFHFAATVLHHAAGASGRGPAAATPGLERQNWDQYSRLRGQPDVLEILQEFQALTAFQADVVRSVSAHRKALGKKMKDAHDTYIRIFEKLLATVLRMQRKRDRRVQARMREAEDGMESLRGRYEVLQAQLADVGAKLEASHSLLNATDARYRDVRRENEELQRYRALYTSSTAQAREAQARRAAERAELEARLKRDEKALLQRLVAAERAWEEEKAQLLRREEERRQRLVAQWRARHHKPRPTPAARQAPPPSRTPSREVGVQTELDDDGLWDKQNGWPVQVSSLVLVKLMWRRGARFAACPACRGVGKFKDAIEGMLRAGRGKGLAAMGEPGGGGGAGRPRRKGKARRSRLRRQWCLPDELVDFLGNLPPTIQAQRPKPLAWLCREMWAMFDAKHAADVQDDLEGQQVQTMNLFQTELFLKRHGLRQLAEMKMYEFVISLKEHFSDAPMAHVFARFMNCLDDGPERSTSRRDRGGPSDAADEGGRVRITNCELDATFLSAALYLRKQLLAPYAWHARAVRPTPAPAAGFAGLPDHVITTDGVHFRVPLDRAVEVFRDVVNFFPERNMARFFRHIEHEAVLLTRRGGLHAPEGHRMIVRSIMRSITLHQERRARGGLGGEERPDLAEDAANFHRDFLVAVDLHVVMELAMEALLIRTQHLQERLKRLFVEGDDNGDGVLSYSEFHGIVSRVAPHFSDRRILRMFREALTAGAESSFAIEKGTFCDVCKAHGLVKLIEPTGERAEAGACASGGGGASPPCAPPRQPLPAAATVAGRARSRPSRGCRGSRGGPGVPRAAAGHDDGPDGADSPVPRSPILSPGPLLVTPGGRIARAKKEQ